MSEKWLYCFILTFDGILRLTLREVAFYRTGMLLHLHVVCWHAILISHALFTPQCLDVRGACVHPRVNTCVSVFTHRYQVPVSGCRRAARGCLSVLVTWWRERAPGVGNNTLVRVKGCQHVQADTYKWSTCWEIRKVEIQELASFGVFLSCQTNDVLVGDSQTKVDLFILKSL